MLLHLAFGPDCWVARRRVCCEVVQVFFFFFSSVATERTPTGMPNSRSSHSSPRFQLGGTRASPGLAAEGTEGALILHLETCVHFKLECKLGIVNGFSLAGQSGGSHRGAEVISIREWRRCRAEPQPAPLVQREPCWQRCAESGAVPRLPRVTSATNAHWCLTPQLQSPVQPLTAVLMVPPCGKY